MGFGIMELLFALIALGLGYTILNLASKSDAGMQGLGKAIGWAMIAISTVVILLTLYIFTTIIVRSITGPKVQTIQQERVVKPAPVVRTVVK